MKKEKKLQNQPAIFQAKNGAIELRADTDKETVWASLDQMVDIFGRDKSVILRHIKNVTNDGELNRDSVVAFFATTAKDGKTYNDYSKTRDEAILTCILSTKQTVTRRRWC